MKNNQKKGGEFMTIGYTITFALAIGLLIAYLTLVKNKEFWLTMLYICISMVNFGYLLMSVANSLELAVVANDVVYFGSVFLSICMMFTIVKLSGFEIKRWYLTGCLVSAVVMFLIVASSPMLPLYYKSIDIEVVDGSTKLVKEYGFIELDGTKPQEVIHQTIIKKVQELIDNKDVE